MTERIGMILDMPFPPDLRVSNECKTLIDSGIEVHLFALSYNRKFKKKEVIDGIHVHRYYCPPLLYKFSALAYTFPYYHYKMRKLISAFIEKTAIKIIHIHDLQIARAVFQLKEKFNLHVTLDLHENRPEIMKFYKHVKSLSGRLLINTNKWKKWEEQFAKEADKVIVVTEFAKSELIERTNIESHKIIALPNTSGDLFTNDQEFDFNIVHRYKDFFTLLYIGDTSERRGLLTAIEAINIIKKDIDNIKLVIVGKSSFDEVLVERISALGLNDIIDMEGWQAPSMLPSYIAGCEVGVSPLYKNIHHDTTYANKIFQYMSLGKPILVSDCTAQEELVKETNCGLVFKNKSVEDFAAKTIDLFQNKEQFEKMATNAKAAVETKYNWSNTGKVLSEYYLSIN